MHLLTIPPSELPGQPMPLRKQMQTPFRFPVLDLWFGLLFIVLVILFAISPSNVISFLPLAALHFITGLIAAVLLPGYFVTAGLFPYRSQLTDVERWGLSLVLSAVVTSMVGFLLSEFHIWFGSLSDALGQVVITGVFMALTLWRRMKTSRLTQPAAETAASTYVASDLYAFQMSTSRSARWTYATVAALALITWGVVYTSYHTVYPAMFITSPSGQLSGYPFQIREGQAYPLTLHVTNHTGQSVTYRLRATIAPDNPPTTPAKDTKTWWVDTLTVAPHAQWTHSLTLPAPGSLQHVKMTVNLYSPTSSHPVRTVWLYYYIIAKS